MDVISRIIDFDDWGVFFECFSYIDYIWGFYIVDCFVNFNNCKLIRFYFCYWNLDVEGVDVFCDDWGGENNWLVFLVFFVFWVIRYFVEC